MTKPMCVGVVGCGYWGPNLLRNFRSLQDCQASDVCDTSRKRLQHMKSLYPDVHTHDTLDEMLNVRDLDAVAIATPVHLHHKLALQCLEAGKHVMIEKPMASSVAQCEELTSVAAKKSLTLMVGHTFLYSPHVRKVKDIVNSGDIGEVRYISSRRLNLGLFQEDINVVWDLAPHDISIVEYLMGGAPGSVNCQGNAHVTKGIEDIANLTMQFPSGQYATVQTSWLDPRKVREMTIVGSKKMIVYDDLQPLHKISVFDHRVETPPHYSTYAEFHYAYYYGDIHFPYVKPEEPLKIECQHFVDCIGSGRTPLTSAKQGTDVVRVLEASSVSLRQGGGRIEI